MIPGQCILLFIHWPLPLGCILWSSMNLSLAKFFTSFMLLISCIFYLFSLLFVWMILLWYGIHFLSFFCSLLNYPPFVIPFLSPLFYSFVWCGFVNYHFYLYLVNKSYFCFLFLFFLLGDWLTMFNFMLLCLLQPLFQGSLLTCLVYELRDIWQPSLNWLELENSTHMLRLKMSVMSTSR